MITYDFNTLIKNQINAIQSLVVTVLDFTVGSVLRAIVESNASMLVWLQSLLLQILATTRASTSTGTDLDSWMNDYGVVRLPAVPSSGSVTFSRFTPAANAIIPVGTTVISGDSSQEFAVIADITNPAYDSSTNSYTVLAGTASITVPIKNVTIGSGVSGNMAIGTITLIGSSIIGIDTVTNNSVFINGRDQETDDELRTRFILFIASLSEGTIVAVSSAIDGVQAGLDFAIVENHNYDDTVKLGYFYVVVDDGSGSPSDTLISSVMNVVDVVRPLSSTFTIYKPVVVPINISLSIQVATGDGTLEKSLATAALSNYIDSLKLGATVLYTMLPQIVRGASANIINVSPGYTVNGITNDVAISTKQIAKIGTITFG